MMLYLRLFFEFFKTGLFAVGGGMATLPFLYDISDATGWFTHAQIVDMVAVSESTPGPIGINMATFVGFITAGVPGSIVATVGLVFPSVVIILIVAAFLKAFRCNRYVEAVFYGLRPASTALIAAAGYLVLRITLFNTELYAQTGNLLDLFQWKSWILAAILLYLTLGVKKLQKVHPVVWIAASAVVGVVFSFAGV